MHIPLGARGSVPRSGFPRRRPSGNSPVIGSRLRVSGASDRWTVVKNLDEMNIEERRAFPRDPGRPLGRNQGGSESLCFASPVVRNLSTEIFGAERFEATGSSSAVRKMLGL